MTDLEKGWLAGIMEGEGYCKWIDAGSSQGQAKFNLQMTDKDVVEKVARLLDLKVNTSPPKGRNKQVYRIGMKSWDKVEQFCIDMMPLMGERRRRDMEVICEKAEARRQWISKGGRREALRRDRNGTGRWV